MSRAKEDVVRISAQLNDAHYKHAILVSNTVFSRLELFTLTLLSLALYFSWDRDDIVVLDNSKIIGFSFCVLILVRFLTRIFWGVKIESIFIVKALGLQTTTVYHSNFKSSKFIPWHLISDVVINEAIVMQNVIFYLAVLVKAGNNSQGESIIPIFINARPRLVELKKIYTRIQLILKE